ncbi:MAG: hypothetical protein KME38_16890 [Spirirestis rafaelensis WJT71-NPBG6]|jgi:hypothetical protein|nr:hypothetical protein [Spirirestis rafaelensis WJT71-NPBG6]
MQIQSSPLKVIFNPPGVQSGMPGDTLQLYAIVINQGNQSAVIDVFFDEAFQIFTSSNISPRQRIALAPQQKTEVSFEFQIPINVQPGTYSYTLIVDAPEHYPQETPIPYLRQIKVQPKEHTVIREHDPTFSVKPATNPSNPLIFKFGEALQIEVTVDNRSSRVDRFRLTCLDFEETWFTILYLKTGLEGAGLLYGGSGLELNPGSQGQILLQFHPPTDILAGSYSPTIRLHSNNSPDLVLLDLVYIQIPEIYHIDVELNTILGIVSRSFGKYEVKLANRGNTVRELAFSANTQDEEELCTYEFQPSQVRVLPTKSAVANLIVNPVHRWRRPFFGSALINFKIELKDQQKLPLPDKFPQATLVWKARPWWQFLLLFLLVLGLLGGVALIVLRILHPDPLKLDNFQSSSLSYQEGDPVRLTWEIGNAARLQKLILITTGEETKEDLLYDSNNTLKEPLGCQTQQQLLSCTNFPGTSKPGEYTFTLKAFDRSGQLHQISPVKLKIKQNPAPEVVSFQADKSEYEKGEKVTLTWQIRNPEQLKKLQIIRKQEDGIVVTEHDFDELNQGIPMPIKSFCKKDNQQVTCKNIPSAINQPGTYTFALQPFAKSIYQSNIKQTETNKVKIKPKPFEIVYFTLNDSSEPNIVVEEGQPVILKWKVVGEDINVQISNLGNVKPEDSRPLIANQALPSQIEIIVTDKFNQPPLRKGFFIKVQPVPTPNNNIAPSNVPDNSL